MPNKKKYEKPALRLLPNIPNMSLKGTTDNIVRGQPFKRNGR